ncbi:DUF4159 domain-containing protein [candidate division KSB1 bacterium]|nr:DUF4159 domain-containing protein [candidate division KSB1 bacterium]
MLIFAIRVDRLMGQSEFTIARLKYRGGGDWYNDPTAIPNLLNFVKQNTLIQTAQDEKKLTLLSEELFTYPMLFITGHGKMVFSDEEVKNLRTYLMNGGFLYADDDYGMDEFFRAAIKKAFPDKELVEIPFSHPIYHCHYDFPTGPPKIHEHDGGPPKAFGLFHESRLILYYTFNTNISDGWPDADVHGNPEDVRLKAFKMGTNIVVYALLN